MYTTIRDRANRQLEIAERDFVTAKTRMQEIEKAVETLSKNGVPQDLTDPIMAMAEEATDDMRSAMVLRMLVRDGMKFHGWLPDND